MKIEMRITSQPISDSDCNSSGKVESMLFGERG